MDQLPAEIVEHIADQIVDNDLSSLLALRRVCRSLEAKTHRTFINRCFVTRRIDTSVESMQQLTNLMRFSPYASLVQHLIIDGRQQAVGVEEDIDAAVIDKMLKWFSGRTLESVTFVNEADDDHTDKLMVASGTLVDDCSSYGRFLQRFYDLTWAAYTFLPSMAEHGLKFARFAVPGMSHEYAIGPWAMAGAGGSFAPFSTLRHLALNIFPTGVSVLTGINLSGREDAVTLAQFINSAPQLSTLKLTTYVETWDGADYDYPGFTSNLFACLDVPSVETVVLDGWERVNFRTMLRFFRNHQNISHLELLNFELDARDRPQIESWVEVFEYLKEYQGLTEFTWCNLSTTNDKYWKVVRDMAGDIGMAGPRPTYQQRMKDVLTSSHSRACDIEGCSGGCFSMNKRHVVGRPAIEGTLSRMIANFERS